MKKRSLFLVLIAAILVLPVGCGRSTTVPTPEGGEVTVKEKGDEVDMTVTGPDGQTLNLKSDESGVALPDDFPKDVPLLPGAKPTGVVTMGDATTVTFETDKKVADVAVYYEKVLATHGWRIEISMAVTDGTMVAGTKEKRAVQVMATKRDTGAAVTLSVSQAP
ncbi:MAG TPA: hypothetical protein DD670_17010 [Planctomycetaceae bacterium]|nr:hypothetical protein [Planctomycetaceae bacterium]